jgi:peptide chain release factor subunit 1
MAEDNLANVKLTSKDRFKVKHFIKELEQHSGRGTELVSVYVPAGYDLAKIGQHLAQEQGTASNIKSSSTRKNVTDALERMIQSLKLIDRTPPNGLAIFSGNVSEREGQSDVQVFWIEPPIPNNLRLYRCEKQFIIEPLKEIVDDENVFGMIVVDKREGDVALLKGKTIVPLSHSQSAVPGKHKSGGQSAARFERLRDGAAKEFYRRVADHAKESFFPVRAQLKGILLGGPGTSKEEFLEQGELPQELKDKVIAIKDLSYTGDFGLQELLEKCEDVLAAEEVVEEKRAMQKFFGELAKSTGFAAYGRDAVLQCVQMGAVDTLLLSEALPDEDIEYFSAEADKLKSKVILVSMATREGAQLKEMGKFAAILRYPVET